MWIEAKANKSLVYVCFCQSDPPTAKTEVFAEHALTIAQVPPFIKELQKALINAQEHAKKEGKELLEKKKQQLATLHGEIELLKAQVARLEQMDE